MTVRIFTLSTSRQSKETLEYLSSLHVGRAKRHYYIYSVYMYAGQLYVIIFTQFTCKLTKVRPLFTLSHIRSDNYPLLIVFSANYIDQSIVILNDFRHLQKYCTSFKICHLIGRNHDAIWKYKVNTKFT